MGAGGGRDPPRHPQGGRAERWPELGTPPPGPAAPAQRGHQAALPHAAPSQGCSQHPPWRCSTWGSRVGCVLQARDFVLGARGGKPGGAGKPAVVTSLPGVWVPTGCYHPLSRILEHPWGPATSCRDPRSPPASRGAAQGGSQGAAPMGEGLPPDSPAGCSRWAPRVNPPPPGPQPQRGRLAADVEGKELEIPSPNRVPQRQPCSSPPSSRPAESKHPAAAAHSCAGPGLGAAAPRPRPHGEPTGAAPVLCPHPGVQDTAAVWSRPHLGAFGGACWLPREGSGRRCGVLHEAGVIYFCLWSRASTGLGVPDPRKAVAGWPQGWHRGHGRGSRRTHGRARRAGARWRRCEEHCRSCRAAPRSFGAATAPQSHKAIESVFV